MFGLSDQLHLLKACRLCIYIRTTDTSHVVEYLGRAGLKLKISFKTYPYTNCNSPNGISFSVLIKVDKTNLAVFTDE